MLYRSRAVVTDPTPPGTGVMAWQIETASGKIVDEIKINILDESSTDYLSDAVISPDKTKIASQYSIGLGSQSYIIVTDLKSKKSTRSDTYEGYITELNWLDDRDLLFSTTDDIYNNSVRFNTTDIISNDNTVIHCINTDDYSEKWKRFSGQYRCRGLDFKRMIKYVIICRFIAIFNKCGSFYLLSVRRASGDEIPPAIIIDVGYLL